MTIFSSEDGFMSATRQPAHARRFKPPSIVRKPRRRLDLLLEPLEERELLTAVPLTYSHPDYWGDTGWFGESGRWFSSLPSISADGQLVAFESSANNLVPNDFNNTKDIFLFNRATGRTTLVSMNRDGTGSGNAQAVEPKITPDGRFILYHSDASDLVPGIDVYSGGGHFDLYVYDVATGQTDLVSISQDGTRGSTSDCVATSISPDGRYVVFQSSAANLVANDTNNRVDVFVRDRVLRTTEMVSLTEAGGASDNNSQNGSITPDGRFVIFSSWANLAAADTNSNLDVYLRDRQSGTTRLISQDFLGEGAGSNTSDVTSQPISADGRFVVFVSDAANLVTQNTNGQRNVFVRDVVNAKTYLVSRNGANTAGTNGFHAVITPDGRYVAFLSNSNAIGGDVPDTNNRVDVYRADLTNLNNIALRMVSVNAAGTNGGDQHSGVGMYPYDFSWALPVITPNGRYVVFASEAGDLVSTVTDANQGQASNIQRRDVFVRDLQANVTYFVSVNPDGANSGNLGSYTPAMNDPAVSGGKVIVAFESAATALVSGVLDRNGAQDLFVRDVSGGSTQLVSRRSPLFSQANLTNSGINELWDVSPDGRFVAFTSNQTDVVPSLPDTQWFNSAVYVIDRQTGLYEQISVRPSGTNAGSGGGPVRFAADARYVYFRSADALQGGVDPVGRNQLYRRDRLTNTTTMVTVSANASQGGNVGVGTNVEAYSVSADGRFVAFFSESSDLITGFTDGNGTGWGAGDVFLRDMATGETRLISHIPGETKTSGNGVSFQPVVSADGSKVLFRSNATNLVTGLTDTNNQADLFVYDVATQTIALVSVNAAGTGTGNSGEDNSPNLPGISADGRYVVFHSDSTDLVPQSVSSWQVYRRDLVAGVTELVSARLDGTAAGNSQSSNPYMSADGKRIVFQSLATNLTATPTPSSVWQVYVRDFNGPPQTTLISTNAAGTSGGNASSETYVVYNRGTRISGDGRYVAFLSHASDLVPGFRDGAPPVYLNGYDLYVKDLQTGRVFLASENQSGTGTGDQGAASGAQGHGGTYLLAAGVPTVIFDTRAENMTNGDRNWGTDLFAYTVNGSLGSISGKLFNDENGNGVQDHPTPGPGLAPKFDGSNDIIVVPNHADLDLTTAATFSAWVRFDKTPAQNSRNASIIDLSANGGNDDLGLWAYTDGKFRFFAANGRVAISTTVIQPNVWYHVAGTYKANDRIQIFVNGVMENAVLIPGVTRTQSGYDLSIGGHALYGGYLNGVVDEAQVWNRARTQAEIQADMDRSLQGNEAGLMGYWNFNESSGITVRDVTGRGRDGTLGGMNVYAQPRRVVSTVPLAQGPTNVPAREGPLVNWTVYLDANNNGVLDAGERSVVTDREGEYRFSNLPAGTHRLRVVALAGHQVVGPAAGVQVVNLTSDTEAVAGRDFAVYRLRPDLAVTQVTAPATAMPGQSVNITWTVRNNDAADLVAAWQDAVYLSVDDILDATDTLVGTLSREGGLAGQASYTANLNVVLPSVSLGTYRFIVQTDRRYQVRDDSNRANNVRPAAQATTLDVPTLVLGQPKEDAFSTTGEQKFYKLVVPQGGGALVVALNSLAATGATAVYLRKNVPPTLWDFDARSEAPSRPDQAIAYTTLTPGVYFVMARAVTGAAASAGFTLTATRTTSPGLTQVSPNLVGNIGTATFLVAGINFQSTTSFRLVQGAQERIPTQVEIVNPGLARVTFDMTGASLGGYDVRAVDGAETFALANAVRVELWREPVLEMQVITPGFVRVGREHTVVVSYRNTGNTDMVAPLLMLAVDDGKGYLRLVDQPGFSGASVPFLAISPDGAPGVLRPGQEARLRFRVMSIAEGAHDAVNYSLSRIDNPGELIDWNSRKNAVRPPGMSAEAWDAIWAQFTAAMGPTVATQQARLAAFANYLADLGFRTADVARLISSEIGMIDRAGNLAPPIGTTDAQMPALGPPLAFSRQYATTVGGRYRDSILGPGWQSNWDLRLQENTEQSTVEIQLPQGIRRFYKQQYETYLGAPGDQASLTRTTSPNPGWLLIETDGTRLTFDVNGRLTKVEDGFANAITVQRDAANPERITALVHSSGAALTFTYHPTGKLASVADSAGRTTTYTYNAQGLLHSVTNALGTTTYGYAADTSGLRRNALTSITDPAGQQVLFAYDALGRLTRTSATGDVQPATYAYGTFGAVTITDPRGQATQLWFNDRGQVERSTDPLGRTTSADYDGVGNLIRLVGPDGATTEYQYDQQGRRTLLRDPMGREITFSYAHDHLQTFTDALKRTTWYNTVSNRLSNIFSPASVGQSNVEVFLYDTQGRLTAQFNRRGDRINFEYDARGLPTRRIYPNGQTVDYTYDARGRLTSATNSTGTVGLVYNALDQVTRVNYPAGRFLEFTYDAAGRRASSRDQDNFTVNYLYDPLGRLHELRDGANGLITRYTYDAADNIIKQERGNGTSVDFTYDAAGQLIQVVNRDSAGGVIEQFDYTYNAAGVRDTMTTAAGITRYGYDANGQLIRVELPGGRTIDYQYDAAGNRTHVLDSSLGTSAYQVDQGNQVVAVGSVTFTYDPDGNMIQRVDAAGTTTYAYDFENRLIGQTGPDGTLAFEYNAIGQRSVVTRNGVRTDYVVDPLGLGNVVGEYSGLGGVKYVHGVGELVGRFGTGGDAYFADDGMRNITALTNASGQLVNQYRYLPFGETTVVIAGLANPFTYQGDVGVQTDAAGRFFMRARTYDVTTGQFASADPLGVFSGDFNFRRYVSNAPTMLSDPSGLTADPCGPPFDWGGFFFGPMLGLGGAGAGLGADAANRVARASEAAQGLYRNANPALRLANSGRLETSLARAGAFGALGTGLAVVTTTYSAYQTVNDFRNGNNALGAWHGLATAASAAALATPFLPPPAAIALIGVNGLIAILDPVVSDAAAKWDAAHKKPDKPTGPKPKPSDNVVPCDPNDITGPAGYGEAGWIRNTGLFPYLIRFENKSDATAPAQEVRITHQLDSDLDWTTFELGEFAFGSVTVAVPEDLQSYATRVPYTNPDGSPLFVDVSASLDPATGVVTWLFRSVDPETGDLPEDALAGFLPPNDTTQRGEGSVNFTIRPKADLPTGTAVHAQASIRFDNLPPIETNIFVNTLDGDRPTGALAFVAPLITGAVNIPLSWSGSDMAGGSGLSGFDVLVSANNGPWQIWLENTPNTSATFPGADKVAYRFQVIAIDNAGNRQNPATAPIFGTQVVQHPAAVRDVYAVDAGKKLTVGAAAGVLANDTKLAGRTRTAVLVDNAAKGTLALKADGSFTYTPGANFDGIDTFTYLVRDNTGRESNVQTVTLATQIVNFRTSTVSFSEAANATATRLMLDLRVAPTAPITFPFFVVPLTAIGGGVDFTLADGTVTFAAGQKTQTIAFTLNNDVLNEGTEQFQVWLGTMPEKVAAGPRNVTTVSVTDNDPLPKVGFRAKTGSGQENANGAMEIFLSAPSGRSVTVTYAVSASSTAKAPGDHGLINSTVTFQPGETSKFIVIPIVDDALDELDERIVVTLAKPVNAVVAGNTSFTYTIIDNDAPPTVQFTSGASAHDESAGTIPITVTLAAASGLTASVKFRVVGGTAKSGTDFVLASGTLTFKPGEVTKTINVRIINDKTGEPDETVIIALSDAKNAMLGTTAEHTLTILDDDGGVPGGLRLTRPAVRVPQLLWGNDLLLTDQLFGSSKFKEPRGYVPI
jgi:RHS repeat-associated protein